MKEQTLVFLNPFSINKVSYDHLNNVSEFDREYTYGFFDDRHEQIMSGFKQYFHTPHGFRKMMT